MPASLSVVIPAYNEGDRLPATLRRVAAYLKQSRISDTEIIVVNDGSSDSTAEASLQIAEKLQGAGLAVRLLHNPGNRGKGYSVRHGVLAARYEAVLFSDADLSAPIEECDKLLPVLQAGNDIVIGSRALDRSLIGVHQSVFRETLGRGFNLIVQVAAGLPFHDTQCGFKLFNRRAVEQIFPRQQLERFGFDVEILFLAMKLGLRVAEVPVRWNHCEGTKVGMFSGADAFLDIFRIRRNDWLGKYNHLPQGRG